MDAIREMYARWAVGDMGEDDQWGDVTAEPRGLDYAEVSADGVPAIWLGQLMQSVRQRLKVQQDLACDRPFEPTALRVRCGDQPLTGRRELVAEVEDILITGSVLRLRESGVVMANLSARGACPRTRGVGCSRSCGAASTGRSGSAER
jgi:hypothetical protein